MVTSNEAQQTATTAAPAMAAAGLRELHTSNGVVLWRDGCDSYDSTEPG